MVEQQIVFNDGEAYERAMGVWSRLIGEEFLGWLAPSKGLDWLDVGCGSGAFTKLVMERCAPAQMRGVDPSEAQLVFARTQPGTSMATFQQADAMALPFSQAEFDVAVMALVLFFVPDPAKGVAEMARVVKPGGLVAAYLWDFDNGGFPFEPVREEMRAVGISPPFPPSVQASRAPVLRGLWEAAGFTDIEERPITVSRTFQSFEEFWTITSAGTGMRILEEMAPDDLAQLKARVRVRLGANADDPVTYQSTANAIKGRVT